MTNWAEKRYSTKFGRHLVAKKPLEKGTLITAESPFAAVLEEPFKSSHCAYCFKETLVKRCSKCTGISYCSRKCQKLDWKVHQIECNVFKKSKTRLNMTCRLICRLLIIIKNDPTLLLGLNESPSEKFNFSGIGALLTHNYKFDNEKLKEYELLARGFEMILDSEFCLPANDIVLLFCLSTCNAMTISDAEGSIAGGLYGYLSCLNHSCCANASVSFVGSRAYLIATTPILKGQQIFISYVDDHIPKPTRSNIIEQNYYFSCTCEWCVSDYEPLNLLICVACNGIQSGLTWICKDCNIKCSSNEIENQTKFIETYSNIPCISLSEIEQDFERAMKSFQNTHHVVPKILRCLEKLYRENQNWGKCADIMVLYCNSYAKLYGDFNFRYAILCYKVARYSQLIPTKEAVELAIKWNKRALAILNAFGESEIEKEVRNNLKQLHGA